MKYTVPLTTRLSLLHAARQTASQHRSVRESSLALLKLHTPISISILENILNRSKDTRQQFFAATTLHQLGHSRGMQFLMGFLLWRLPASRVVCENLELAILEIGFPEASTALLDVWPSVPIRSENEQIFQMICWLCAEMKDIRLLETIYGAAHRHSNLFIETCERFGERSLPFIEKMLRDEDPIRRRLAVEAAGKVNSTYLFDLLVPALRDNSAEVRQAVPAALAACSRGADFVEKLEAALQEGWSSPAAVHILQSGNKLSYDICITILNRWPADQAHRSGDSGEPIISVLSYLSQPSIDSAVYTVIGLLSRDITEKVAFAALSYLANNVDSPDMFSEAVLRALLPWLSSIHPKMRLAASKALAGFGCNLGAEFELLLSSQLPKDSIMQKFMTVLKSTPRQLNMYIPTLKNSSFAPLRYSESRLDTTNICEGTDLCKPILLLLRRIDEEISTCRAVNSLDDLLISGIAVLRSCSAVNTPDMAPYYKALQNIVLQVDPVFEARTPSSWQSIETATGILRIEAAAALIRISRHAGFVISIQAASHTRAEVQIAGVKALGLIGDPRAISLLLSLQVSGDESIRGCAKSAVRAIQHQNPEIVSLLRGSVRTESNEYLLRTLETGGNSEPGELLRQSQAEG